jgi:hypothetical protein
MEGGGDVCPQPIGSAMSRAEMGSRRALERAQEAEVVDAPRAHGERELGAFF